MSRLQDTLSSSSLFAFDPVHDLTSRQTYGHVHNGGPYFSTPSAAWENSWPSHAQIGGRLEQPHLNMSRKDAGIVDWTEIDQDMFRNVTGPSIEPCYSTAHQFTGSRIPSEYGMIPSIWNEMPGSALESSNLLRRTFGTGLFTGSNGVTFEGNSGRVTRPEIPASGAEHLPFQNPFLHSQNTFASRDQMGNTTSQPEPPDSVEDIDPEVAHGK
jgi:hypothetical protein